MMISFLLILSVDFLCLVIVLDDVIILIIEILVIVVLVRIFLPLWKCFF